VRVLPSKEEWKKSWVRELLKVMIIGFFILVGILSISFFVMSSKYRIYGTAEVANENFVIDDNVICTYSGASTINEPVVCHKKDQTVIFKNRGLGYGTYSYEFTIEGDGIVLNPIIHFERASFADKENISFVFDIYKQDDIWDATVECCCGGISKIVTIEDVDTNGIDITFFP